MVTVDNDCRHLKENAIRCQVAIWGRVGGYLVSRSFEPPPRRLVRRDDGREISLGRSGHENRHFIRAAAGSHMASFWKADPGSRAQSMTDACGVVLKLVIGPAN